MESKDLKELSLRLERIEKALDTAPRRASVEEITAEELKAYSKVRAALAWEWGTCGINETSPCVLACRQPGGTVPVGICKVCDVECTCGPCNICNIGGGGFGGGGRFGKLGG